MTMTRKHFEAIAEVLNANIAPLELVSDFADMLEQSNERFNRRLFVQAATGKLREMQEFEARMLNKATGRA